jgi:acetyl/propionyl-CoA carboxylase alpha subunit
VDSCGYLGLAPPSQFDPMFAKVIGRSNSSGTLASAVERTRLALSEFHIAGLPTNLG